MQRMCVLSAADDDTPDEPLVASEYHRRMPPVDVERRGAVALLTLNSPPANALGTPVLTALAEAIEALRADDARAVVLTGSGRFFSAGLDLFEVAQLVGSPDAEA